MMEKAYFQRVQEQTPTKFWINNVTREQAHLSIAAGAVGCTQNPAYTWKIIESDEKQYAYNIIDRITKEQKDDNLAMIELQRELIGNIAVIFKPMYDASRGKHGFVSIQGDPFLEDTKSIVEFARYNRKAGENIMAKIPVVEGGLEAVEILAKEYIPINATECMAIRQVLDVCEVYEKATKNMVNPAPLYYSVITGIFDEHLASVTKSQNIDISGDALWHAGMIVAKKAYRLVKSRGYNCHFIGGGARGLHHFTEMVGADAQITINWQGTADKLIEQDPPVVQRFFMPTPEVMLDELLEKLEDFRKAYLINGIGVDEYEEYGPVVLFRSMFETAWTNSVAAIAARR